jgi:hypothetical protein
MHVAPSAALGSAFCTRGWDRPVSWTAPVESFIVLGDIVRISKEGKLHTASLRAWH